MDVDLHLSGAIRPWIHACVVFPQAADLSWIPALHVDPSIILPHGYAKAIVFHPSVLLRYVEDLSPELERDTASTLVRALGGKVEGTWVGEPVIQKREEAKVLRMELQIVWD